MKYPNYRRFFFGQFVSVTGSWMQSTALGWLIYRMTGSKALLGVVAFATMIPMFVLAPLAGVISDRVSRRPILIVSQALALLQALALTALYYTGMLGVESIVVLGVFLGLTIAFDMPVRHAFVVEMVDDRRDLGNAIALNSLLFNGARFLGPALAGVLIKVFRGEGLVFFINALTYLAVIAAYVAIRTKPRPKRAQPSHVLADLSDGLKYVFRCGPIRGLMLMIAVISFVGMPYTVLMPVFARDVLVAGGEALPALDAISRLGHALALAPEWHGAASIVGGRFGTLRDAVLAEGAQTQGWLLAASGFGAILGAIHLASRRDVTSFPRKIPIAAAVFGVGLAVFAQSRWLVLSLVALPFVGLSLMVEVAAGNTVVQTMVDEDKRGRVMGLFGLCFLGISPFGNLVAGMLSQWIGAPWTLTLSGIVCLVAAGVFTTKLRDVSRMTCELPPRADVPRELAEGLEAGASEDPPASSHGYRKEEQP